MTEPIEIDFKPQSPIVKSNCRRRRFRLLDTCLIISSDTSHVRLFIVESHLSHSSHFHPWYSESIYKTGVRCASVSRTEAFGSRSLRTMLWLQMVRGVGLYSNSNPRSLADRYERLRYTHLQGRSHSYAGLSRGLRGLCRGITGGMACRSIRYHRSVGVIVSGLHVEISQTCLLHAA